MSDFAFLPRTEQGQVDAVDGWHRHVRFIAALIFVVISCNVLRGTALHGRGNGRVMTRHAMRAVAVVVLLGTLLMAKQALGLPNFPSELGAEGLPVDPLDCPLCHTGVPSRETATSIFAECMKAHGLVRDVASVTIAIDAMRNAAVDCDGDGAADIAELEQGFDPNDPQSSPTSGTKKRTVDGATYGCGATWSATPPRGSTPWLVVLSAWCACLWIRRRRSEPIR